MKFIKYFLATILTLATLVFLSIKLKIIEFKVGSAKFEDKSSMQTIDNSALQTIEAFVGQDQFVKYKGKAIFLNSWASWCPACIKEFPALNSIGKSCAGDSNIACVSYCSDLQTITEVDSFKNSRNLQLTFEDVISKSGLRMSLRKLAVEQLKISNVDTSLDLVPLNVIVDKLGNIVYYNSAISYEDTSKILALLKGN